MHAGRANDDVRRQQQGKSKHGDWNIPTMLETTLGLHKPAEATRCASRDWCIDAHGLETDSAHGGAACYCRICGQKSGSLV
jgi:hypothetical protein